jgi:hypothetical protein
VNAEGVEICDTNACLVEHLSLLQTMWEDGVRDAKSVRTDPSHFGDFDAFAQESEMQSDSGPGSAEGKPGQNTQEKRNTRREHRRKKRKKKKGVQEQPQKNKQPNSHVGGPSIVPHAERLEIAFVTGYHSHIRDFWQSYLNFVPPSLGPFAVSIEDLREARRVKQHFAQAEPGAHPIIMERCATQTHSIKANIDKRLWKYFLDLYIDSPVIALSDDDACFSRTVTYEDFLENGKVVARGLNTELHRLNSKDLPLIQHLYQQESIANFMVDFPVAIWKDMLPDLRSFLIKKELGLDMPSNLLQTGKLNVNMSFEKEMFVKAMERLWAECPLFDEFGLLYHFAWFSADWHDKYAWRFAPYDVHGHLAGPVHSCSVHQMFADRESKAKECPKKGTPLPRDLSLYPSTYGMYWNGSAYNEFSGSLEWNQDLGLWKDNTTSEAQRRTAQDSAALDMYFAQSSSALLSQYEDRLSTMYRAGTALSHVENDPEVLRTWAACWSKSTAGQQGEP